MADENGKTQWRTLPERAGAMDTEHGSDLAAVRNRPEAAADALERHQLRRALAAVLERLGGSDRRVLLERYVRGQASAQIAAAKRTAPFGGVSRPFFTTSDCSSPSIGKYR